MKLKWLVERKIIAGVFVLAMLILGIVNIISYKNTAKLVARQQQVEHSYERLQKVRDVLTTLRDAERARRGYIITGKEFYLDTYNTAIKTIDTKFDEAHRATADELQQRKRLDSIKPLIAERVTLVKKSVELYKKNKSDMATQIELTDKGIMLHDRIWKVIAEMEQEEQSLLRQKQAESAASFRKTMLINISGSCLSFAMLFAVYWFLNRQISSRKKVEKNLRVSEQRYRHLFELNPHPLWVYDCETLEFLAVNDAAVKHYGYSRSEFLAMTIKEIRPREDLPAFLNQIADIPPGFRRAGVFKHQKQDGSIIYVEATSHEVVYKGRRARLVLCRDITEDKKAKEALEASEEKFRQIAENIHEVFWISDADATKILYVNPAYEKIWGRSCESLYTQQKSLVDDVHPEDRNRFIKEIQHNSTREFETEYRIIRPDGSMRWILYHSFPIRNTTGEIFRRAGIAQDITERKRAEEVRRTLEKERELNELKLRFFSMASHEFRTPLSTILISAQVLENSTKEWPEEKKKKNLERIKSAAKNMTQLLTDILTLSRAEAGNLEFQPRPLDLEKFCYSLVEEIEFSTRAQQNIFFISNFPSEFAYMDEKLLRSILINLLDNAIKYSSENSQIYFTLSCESNQAIFKIQDKGIGISDEDKENLYQAFQRGKNVGDIVGTGLGLAVVKKCVQLHGGSITVDSEVDVGTTFTVTIPWESK
jgi:PAS domain S-box-containing protein